MGKNNAFIPCFFDELSTLSYSLAANAKWHNMDKMIEFELTLLFETIKSLQR